MDTRFVIVLVLFAATLVSCGTGAMIAQEPVVNEDLQVFETPPTPKPTADSCDFAGAAEKACYGIVQWGELEGWNLPTETQEICESKFQRFYENHQRWPNATGMPSQAHTFANSLALELEINDYRGAPFVVKMKGFMYAQRQNYNWPD